MWERGENLSPVWKDWEDGEHGWEEEASKMIGDNWARVISIEQD